ncbi:MAG: ABC transporter permease [Saprospiraceae bacterium]|nr:ABC transporter permease [Saprospiraceae bacterium]
MEASGSEYQKAWQRFRRNRPALFGLWFIAAAVCIAIFAYPLAPDDSTHANEQIPEIALHPPGFRVQILQLKLDKTAAASSWFSYLLNGRTLDYKSLPLSPGALQFSHDSVRFAPYGSPDRLLSLPLHALKQPAPMVKTYPLGADRYGRCMLSRLILGFRVSLTVGLISVVISLSIGVAAGALGGYFGGRTDDLIMLAVNTVWSIPTLLLVFAVVLALGRGIGIIFLAVGLTLWVDVARVVRGQVLSIKQLAFIEATKSMGLGRRRILLHHILPNLLGPVMVVAAGNFATAILLESGLSYLGFGVQPPAPSWGSLLNENYGYAISGKPLLAMAPALTLAITVLAFNLIGNGLRDAMDVREQ